MSILVTGCAGFIGSHCVDRMLGPGDVERAYADVSRARQLLGYRPSMEFIDGMRIFASWYLSEGGLQDGITEP